MVVVQCVLSPLGSRCCLPLTYHVTPLQTGLHIPQFSVFPSAVPHSAAPPPHLHQQPGPSQTLASLASRMFGAGGTTDDVRVCARMRGGRAETCFLMASSHCRLVDRGRAAVASRSRRERERPDPGSWLLSHCFLTALATHYEPMQDRDEPAVCLHIGCNVARSCGGWRKTRLCSSSIGEVLTPYMQVEWDHPMDTTEGRLNYSIYLQVLRVLARPPPDLTFGREHLPYHSYLSGAIARAPSLGHQLVLRPTFLCFASRLSAHLDCAYSTVYSPCPNATRALCGLSLKANSYLLHKPLRICGHGWSCQDGALQPPNHTHSNSLSPKPP